jgi:signal transduction histidine kinase
MKTASAEPIPISSPTSRRTDELFDQMQLSVWRRTDRMFAGLMLFQWLACVGAALWITPKTWIGTTSQIHIHVWAAIFIGGVITALPVGLALTQPGKTLTRHVIAIGQMLMSALLIHLTGGRIETHFHVFGSLAFLAFYRDWKVLVTATVVVAGDHWARGVFWPQSVFGVLAASQWRWVEHAGWVIFEDIFLFLSNYEGVKAMRLVAQRQAELETINQNIEKVVQERTAELEESHKNLVAASRQAGKAEVATSVLHNVGNVLNSINVSVTVVSDRLRRSKIDTIAKVSNMLGEHSTDLGEFITRDPKGKQIPVFLGQLAAQLASDRSATLEEMAQMAKDVDHIKDIVTMQQTYARVSGMEETARVTDLVEDALRMNASALIRHDVHFFREFEDPSPEITVEKHKILQILVNLIRNAKQACDESGQAEKKLIMRVTSNEKTVRIALIDNGCGIAPENLVRIFNHGFTTKKEGHGFGLHSCALSAKEMGGSLQVSSDGPGKGATFTLELPCSRKATNTGVSSPAAAAAAV